MSPIPPQPAADRSGRDDAVALSHAAPREATGVGLDDVQTLRANSRLARSARWTRSFRSGSIRLRRSDAPESSRIVILLIARDFFRSAARPCQPCRGSRFDG